MSRQVNFSIGLEVDAILKLTNGEYGAIEIKIVSDKNIEEGIDSLTKFENKMKENGLKTPAFKMIHTSQRPSKKVGDIYIVPISMLDVLSVTQTFILNNNRNQSNE